MPYSEHMRPSGILDGLVDTPIPYFFNTCIHTFLHLQQNKDTLVPKISALGLVVFLIQPPVLTLASFSSGLKPTTYILTYIHVYRSHSSLWPHLETISCPRRGCGDIGVMISILKLLCSALLLIQLDFRPLHCDVHTAEQRWQGNKTWVPSLGASDGAS